MGLFISKRAEHRSIKDNLSVYIDGRLPPRERMHIERHLADCQDCTADLATLRQTKALLHTAPMLAVPRSFALPATMQTERERYQRLSRSFSLLSSSSAIVGILLVVLLAGNAVLGYMGAQGSRNSMRAAPVAYGAAPENSDRAIEQETSALAMDATDDAYLPRLGAPAQATAQPAATAAPSAKLGAPQAVTPTPDESTANTGAEEPTLTPAESVGLGGGTSEGEPGAGVASVPEASATIEAYPGAAAENNDVAIAVAGIPDDATSTAEAASSQAEAVAATAESASPDEYADKTADRYQAAWRSVRLGIYVLAGILAILLAGLLWTGHRRKA